MIDRSRINIVGFDLDGTLYKCTPEINDRVRNQIAKEILERKPDLGNIEKARKFFEERYAKLQSGTKVLAECMRQHESSTPTDLMDKCLAEADVVNLIPRDEKLCEILEEISQGHVTYFLTSSPRDLALSKLSALGIDPLVFDFRFYSDTEEAGQKNNGSAFRYAIAKVGGPGKEHLYIGDRLKSDIRPANKMGMQSLAVWSHIPEATASIDHIHKLKGVLQ